jgi:hypothetical protein
MVKCPFCHSYSFNCPLCAGHPVPTELETAYYLVYPQLSELLTSTTYSITEIKTFLRQLRRDVLGDID